MLSDGTRGCLKSSVISNAVVLHPDYVPFAHPLPILRRVFERDPVIRDRVTTPSAVWTPPALMESHPFSADFSVTEQLSGGDFQ